MAEQPRYPEIRVALLGESGIAFMILGLVRRALRKAGIDEAERQRFSADAMSGDYNHLLRTVQAWVTVE